MKKFLILLLALLLPLCASAAITVPEHITDVGAEAFAGVDTDYLVVPAAVQTVGENVLAGSNASYLWLEGASTQVAGNPGVPFIFGPAGSAAANLSGFYAQETLVIHNGLYYALLADQALPLCAVKPADISGSVTIPKLINDLPVTSLDQLYLSNTRITEVRIPRYLTAPDGLPVTTYETMTVDAPVASVTETPAGIYVTWTVSSYTGAYGDVRFVWTFENGGNTISTTTTEPTVKYAPMAEGSCTVTVRVEDSLNDWADAVSEAITVTKSQTVYRALLVGNTYPGESCALPGPDHDVKAMQTMLATMTGTPYTTLRASTNLSATGIQAAIASAFADAQPGDISLFYYSGHGTPQGALVGTGGTYLSVYGLRAALEKIPGTKIVLLDCCHSGTAINKSTSTESVNLSAFNRAIISGLTAKTRSSENLADQGFIVLTACRKDQESVSLSGGSFYWGVFTYGLCYGSGFDEWNQVSLGYLPADANGDGAITLGEAYNGVLERVNFLNGYASSRSRAISQTPTEGQPDVQLLVEQATQYYGDTSFILWKR